MVTLTAWSPTNWARKNHTTLSQRDRRASPGPHCGNKPRERHTTLPARLNDSGSGTVKRIRHVPPPPSSFALSAVTENLSRTGASTTVIRSPGIGPSRRGGRRWIPRRLAAEQHPRQRVLYSSDPRMSHPSSWWARREPLDPMPGHVCTLSPFPLKGGEGRTRLLRQLHWQSTPRNHDGGHYTPAIPHHSRFVGRMVQDSRKGCSTCVLTTTPLVCGSQQTQDRGMGTPRHPLLLPRSVHAAGALAQHTHPS